MNGLTKKIKVGFIATALLAMNLILPLPNQANQALAAQGCALNSFIGTVTVDGVATDNATVTLTDLTNASPALSIITSGGGNYLIESANLATCASVGDTIELTADFNGSSFTTTVTYASQAFTTTNLAITTVVLPVLTSITVSPATASVTVGATQQFSATAYDQFSVAMNPQPVFTWSSADTNLVTIDQTGLATGVAVCGPITITATSNAISGTATLSVTAAPVTYTLAYTAGANGSISGVTPQTINAGADGSTVTAVPNAGFHFVDWSDGVLTTARTDLAVSGNISVTANFAADSAVTFTITSTAGAGGAISPLGATVVSSGANQVYTITPDTGFQIADVLVDGVSVGAVATYTFTNVIAGHTIDASFSAILPVLTSITVSPASASVTVGATQQFSAIAYDQFSVAMNPQPVFTWSSADTNLVTIDQTGLATGVAIGGPITITATSNAVSGTATLSVTAVPPTPTSITVSPITAVYGDTITLIATISPVLSGKSINFTLNGLDKGAALTDANGVATTSVSLTGINAGVYAGGFVASFAGDSAYSSSTATAILTINKKPITVSAATDTKVYDGTITSAGMPVITAGALAGSDTVIWTQIYDNKNVGTGKNLIPFGTVADGNGGNNYAVTFVNDITGVITSKTLTVTANDASKTFGATLTFTGSEFSSAGLVGGDSITSVTLNSAGAAAGAATSTYPIIPSLATGASINNYSITYVNGLLTVNDKPTPVIIWSNPADITYPAPLSGIQLNATSSVPGTFVYTPDLGAILNIGNNQNLLTQFTPNDLVTYNPTSASVLINILAPAYTASSSDLTGLITSGSLAPASGSSSTSTPSLTANADITINVPDEGSSSQIILPHGTVISSVDGGLIDASLFSAAEATANTFSGMASGSVVNGALQWGITNLGLQFSSPITINMFVGASFNGQTLTIIRSVSGNSGWTNDGIVAPATCLVANGMCSFQATKASYYAATTPAAPAIATILSSGGGGGGGGGSVSLFSNNTVSQTSAVAGSAENNNSSASVIVPQVLGEKNYPDGTLLREPNKKIYLIVGGEKVRILNLAQLARFKGMKINDVTADILAAYPNVDNLMIYATGSLIRTPNKKIYLITSTGLNRLLNLQQLMKYRGRQISDVSYSVLAQYQTGASGM